MADPLIQSPRANILLSEFYCGEDLELIGGAGVPTEPDFEDDLDQETTEGEIHTDPSFPGEGTWIVGGGWSPVEQSVTNYIWWDLGQDSAVGFVEFEYMMKSGCPPLGHNNLGSPFGSDYLDLHTMVMLFGEFDPQVFTAGPPNGIGTFGIEMTTGLPPNNGVFKVGNCIAPQWESCAGEQLTCTVWPYAVDEWIKVKLEWESGDTRVFFNENMVYESIGGPDTLYRYFTIGGKDDVGDPLWGTPVPPHAYQNVKAAGVSALIQGFWGIYGQDWFVWDDPTQGYEEDDVLADLRFHHPQTFNAGTESGFNAEFKNNWFKPVSLNELQRHPQFGNPDEMFGKWWWEYVERINPALYATVEGTL